MEFTVGKYRMRNGNIAEITNRHHGSMLSGWAYRDENKGIGLWEYDSDGKEIVKTTWYIRPYTHRYEGDFAATKHHMYWVKDPSMFDLIEKVD